jgi:hypothetical protein
MFLRTYETPTLTHLGSFAECTGRLIIGFFVDGGGGYDLGLGKFDSRV